MVDEHVSDQNGPIWLYATSGGPCFLSLGVGWLKRTKYGMDWLSGVSTHGWLTHCPLLTCPLYCGFFQSWPRVFVPFTSSGASIAKKSTRNYTQWSKLPPIPPCGLPGAHMLPPVLSRPATCCPLPFFAPTTPQKASKKPAFPWWLVSISFLAQHGSWWSADYTLFKWAETLGAFPRNLKHF